ncbi:hypothetical protein Nepgr_014855 [Nepenthes gracilis]|uniref:Uncharacterized protein n=1 Tax=Nepenthes gracilis TaxID=150966 RepID=A0AAD3SLL1_NEPGR|nr:hypothetical protein Nepgr_014855 [Nepenthes gracilis]
MVPSFHVSFPKEGSKVALDSLVAGADSLGVISKAVAFPLPEVLMGCQVILLPKQFEQKEIPTAASNVIQLPV